MIPVKPVFLLAVGTLVLAGCTDPARFEDGTDPRANTKGGAAAGAALGAITGALIGGDNTGRNAALGAVVGGAIGAAVGDQLDQQAAELRQELGNEISVVNTGSELVVTMPQDILFDVDSAALRPDLQSDLAALSANLQRYPDTNVQVVGHTDNTGEASYNQDLSARRATSVANELFIGGVSPTRVVTLGRGEDQPISSNLTPEGRQQNRRVEIFIRPTA